MCGAIGTHYTFGCRTCALRARLIKRSADYLITRVLGQVNKTVHNELMKLRATYFNSIAAAFATLGSIGPSITVLYGLNSVSADPLLIFTGGAVSLLVSYALHLKGQSALRSLIE
jgi:hypothetical protein